MNSIFIRKITIATLISLLGFASASAGVREIPSVAIQTSQAYGSPGNESLYIVQFDDPPALALPANRQTEAQSAIKRRSRRFNPNNAAVIRYVDKLRLQQNAMLHSVGAEHNRVYSYGYTFNGVAVRLTPQQANKLRLRKGVNRVWEDRRRVVSTSDSPAFLGLFNSDGGLHTDLGLRGEDVVIGIIDSGIAPGHPSFSDREKDESRTPRLCRSSWAETSLLGIFLCRKYRHDDKVVFDPIRSDWNGTCETGDGFTADDCNNKLIGARFYRAGFDLSSDIDVNEFNSPADADGHGTHIASIAAGNAVDANVFGRDVGRISGIAPRARIAVYKACWLAPGGKRASCSIADLQAAIEDAVADGVDIINYAIGELDFSLSDPDDLALLAAADAGILAVTPAGNDGPDAMSILSPAATPWVISVGATSRAGDRVGEGLRINAPESVAGEYESKEASFSPRLTEAGPITANLVLADDGEIATPEDEAGTSYDACSTLNNGSELSGQIALVQRGGCNFDVKLRFAQDAGAVAMIVFNNDIVLEVMAGSSTFASIPAVMIGQAIGQQLRDLLTAGDTVEVTLDKSIFITFKETGDVLGVFSGRGPSFGDSNFLKPDVVAPGVDILGGQSPKVANGFRGENFQYLTGTSQSVPHVAGLAALIKQAQPTWTPAEIKSAMMTSARQNIVREDKTTLADPFDIGAGHIAPNRTIEPGLLFDISTDEYDSYLCTVGLERITTAQCQALVDRGLDLDAQHLNLPSVAITELVASETVTRRVRNPGAPAQFKMQLEVPVGVGVTVTPSVLSLGSNETAEYTMTFTSDGTGLGEWGFGSLSWVNDDSTVYTPFAVHPAVLSVTDEIRASGATGNARAEVRFGYDGNYAASALGLELPLILPDIATDAEDCTPAKAGDACVADDPFNSYDFLPEPRSWVRRFTLEVEPDEEDAYNHILRIALFDELTDGNDDLDLYLYFCEDSNDNEDCNFVASSQNVQTSNELISLLRPDSGTYFLDVHGYDTDPFTGTDGSEFSVYVWALDSSNNSGNLIIVDAPDSADAGTNGVVNVSWQDLADGLWLGGVLHNGNDDQNLDITVIEIDSNTFAAPASE